MVVAGCSRWYNDIPELHIVVIANKIIDHDRRRRLLTVGLLIKAIYELEKFIAGGYHVYLFGIGQAAVVHAAFFQFSFYVLVMKAVYFNCAAAAFPFFPVVGVWKIGDYAQFNYLLGIVISFINLGVQPGFCAGLEKVCQYTIAAQIEQQYSNNSYGSSLFHHGKVGNFNISNNEQLKQNVLMTREGDQSVIPNGSQPAKRGIRWVMLSFKTE
jgi:hypothetical protein